MAKRMVRGLPLKQLITMGLATVFRPRTRGWRRAQAAMAEYVTEQQTEQHAALHLDGGKRPRAAAAAE